ncbi:hypothetical protein APB23_35935 [Pseudomonas aeruginosa]|nr:hypothetical protein BH598_32690 [Pseudomonas aeruginosa]OPE14701.1 hypothetical protein APA77_34550 [Pseudomonas aeruginosa]OPE23341.1 hypothetical protein APB03_35220 [Pseudomonas aeruginosa]OPE28447.1 hypothetical protein APB23_35935 [Pseudomonas aeruginosa]OPE31763.1 hypothetical protein APB25_37290 [Pseudomonas aeruginosa]
MWQVVAQQIAAADPKPLRGFGRLSSSVMHLLSAQRSNEGYLDEKNFAAAYVGVRFRHSPNQFRGF